MLTFEEQAEFDTQIKYFKVKKYCKLGIGALGPGLIIVSLFGKKIGKIYQVLLSVILKNTN